MHLINHGLGDKLVVSATDTTLSSLGDSQRKFDYSDKKTEPSSNYNLPPYFQLTLPHSLLPGNWQTRKIRDKDSKYAYITQR